MAIIPFTRPLVLATASPARRRLVAEAGFSFIPDVASIDESPQDDEKVAAYVERLARQKAEAIVPPALDAVIIAVDTAIGIDGAIIGKPRDREDARAILKRLSGCEHQVASAIALRDIASATIDVEVTATTVRFSSLDDGMIDWYLATGEWKGRAGAYAIQGKGAALIDEVRGCFTNVIGISIPTLLRMLRAASA